MTGAEALVTTLARIELARTDALTVAARIIAARLEQSRARQEAVRAHRFGPPNFRTPHGSAGHAVPPLPWRVLKQPLRGKMRERPDAAPTQSFA